MRRIILSVLMVALALAPAEAIGWKTKGQARKDTKYVVKELKSEGYKPLDNVKINDVVSAYLASKYATKSSVEVIGKGIGEDINQAKAEAREDAIGGYPAEDVVDSFFVFKKTRKRYEVLCYAVLKGNSAKSASRDRVQVKRRSEGTESTISAAKEEQERKAEKAKREKERKKAERKAKREAQSAKR